MEEKNSNTEKLTFEKIREFQRLENQKKYDRSHIGRYSKKKEEIEIKRAVLMEDPIYEYVQFVVDSVCEILRVPKDNILSSYRGDYVTQARYYIIEIVSLNTDLGSDVMYLVNRDRTSYYHVIDSVDTYKTSYVQKRQYDKCFNACTMSAFNRFKKEKDEKGKVDNG
jgi:hypothetical protein